MAQLSTADMNDAPDSDFAYVSPGGTKDSGGKTVPRSNRHFYIADAAHVRNALARAGQGAEFGDKAMPSILAAAKKFGITVSGQNALPEYGATELRFTGPPQGRTELRAAEEGDAKRIVGYASVFNSYSRNLGGFVEQVDPSAFNKSRADGFPGTVCRYNHDPNVLLGTVGGGTLSLRVDPRVGLYYDVLPPQSRADIMELVDRGDVRHSSFAFRVPSGGDEWSTTDQKYPQRRLLEVELVDVAPVVDPAYTDATAGMRSQAAMRSLAAHMGAPIDDVLELAAKDELR